MERVREPERIKKKAKNEGKSILDRKRKVKRGIIRKESKRIRKRLERERKRQRER